MEIMEDGNLVDRVRILLQRDMQYYQEMQTVLKEPLCTRISGGRLDFPRHASFAAIKIVTWWEADFQAAFKCSGLINSNENDISENAGNEERVIKKIQPSEFVLLVVDTAEKLLEHLHVLIQESLDHADLTVLTATLGAAALIRNCLWYYNRHAKNLISSQSRQPVILKSLLNSTSSPIENCTLKRELFINDKLNKAYKSYHEMAEAVAERLLDLHCRLISLYILNEADSLSWHDTKSFFERERCSFVVQMWWLYMQGTKTDLWNTVSPKMAQRIFIGMLNESLTIIVTRFIYGRPSLPRSEQFWADAFNILCCTGYLALGACTSASEIIAFKLNKLPTAIRDIHTKCNELLICLLLRGTPLRELYQMFRVGIENLTILQSRNGPAPWILVCVPNLLASLDSDVCTSSLLEDRYVILELNILRHQPQPNWPQLIKVLSMNDYAVAKILLNTLIYKCGNFTSDDDFENLDELNPDSNSCDGFLCSGGICKPSMQIQPELILYSLTYIIACIAQDPGRVIIPALKQNAEWSKYLDRQQIWSQSRPPWLNAILNPLKGMMQPIIEILLEATKTGASIYQAMSLVIGCFTELYVTLPFAFLNTALTLNDNIPAHCHPIGGNVPLHILCTALYAALIEFSKNCNNDIRGRSTEPPKEPDYELHFFDSNDTSGTAIALAEAICSIDEDNKHTSQIDDFFQCLKEYVQFSNANPRINELNNVASIIEVRTDELLFTDTGRRTLKIIHEYVIRSSDLVLKSLRQNNISKFLNAVPEVSPLIKPLTYIMFHIEDTTFDQFLVQYEEINWKRIFTMPLSVTIERVRSLLLLRPEFKAVGELSYENREAVHSLKKICSTIKTAQFKQNI